MTYTIKQRIKGRTYLYEVENHWDPEKKQPRQTRRYLGVWDMGKGELVKKKQDREIKSAKSFGDVYLFSQLVKKTGLDKVLSESHGNDTNSILALAFSRLRGCPSMRLTKAVLEDTFFEKAYSEISSQRISELLGRIPGKTQKFFSTWTRGNKGSSLIYDITSLSSSSEGMRLLEYGYNRDGDGLPQVNLGVVMTKEGSIPLYYKILPGSIPDVSTIEKLADELKFLQLKEYSLVLDRGFYSEDNLKRLKCDFIVPLPLSTNVAKRLVKETEGMNAPQNAIVFRKHVLFAVEKRVRIGGKEMFAYVFHDERRRSDETDSLFLRLVQVEQECNGKKPQDSLEAFVAKYANGLSKYFMWSMEGGVVKCTKKNEELAKRLKVLGKFIILSTQKLAAEELLLRYREKDFLEKFYYSLKNYVGGLPLRVHSDERMMGFMFVMFVTLIIRNRLLQDMKEARLTEKYSLEDVFLEFSKLRAVLIGDDWRLTEVTKKQRELADALGLKFPLKPSY